MEIAEVALTGVSEDMKRLISAKIVTAILIPMLLMSVASYAYAHWTDSVNKRYKLHVRCTYTDIKTNKVLTDWVDDKDITKIPSDEELSEMDGSYVLEVRTHLGSPGFDVWIGMMLHNQGSLPERVYPPTFIVETSPPHGISIESTNFTYGIFSGGEFTEYYAGINRKNFREKLDPNTGIVGETSKDPAHTPTHGMERSLPLVIEPCQKIVIWTYLRFNDGRPRFNIRIRIAVNSELA
jgi:hypothetical protein